MWLDSHCHINDEAYNDDRNEVLQRMVNNGVSKAMIVSLNEEEYIFSKTIKYDGISLKNSVGIYPGDVDKYDEETLNRIISLFKEDECSAVGEIGLDYHWGKENRDRQLYYFERQLIEARKLDKPVIIHSRDAAKDTFDLLKKYPGKGVMHCYAGSKELAREYVKFGYYISFSGVITFKNAKEPLEVIRSIPLDKILIETDCPYLTPVPYRGKRNEPSYVIYTGKKVAEVLDISEEMLSKELNRNYDELFGV
ncbi:MAG: TatD family hydrolase [Erysipelotrichaceae bacterium]|nr:TatD family hydrolase [Erysipelotrichaceae bacterium]